MEQGSQSARMNFEHFIGPSRIFNEPEDNRYYSTKPQSGVASDEIGGFSWNYLYHDSHLNELIITKTQKCSEGQPTHIVDNFQNILHPRFFWPMVQCIRCNVQGSVEDLRTSSHLKRNTNR